MVRVERRWFEGKWIALGDEKEQSRLRLSHDSDHSLIDTIGRALSTLLGGNFELLLRIRTQDNKRYVIKWMRFICKNVYMLFQHRWLQEKTTHVLHFNNLTYVIFWDNSNKLRPWLFVNTEQVGFLWMNV